MPSTAVRPNAARAAGCAAEVAAAAATHASERTVRFIALQYRIVASALAGRISAEVDRAADELVQLTIDLVRIPTVNPPGEAYDTGARLGGAALARRGRGDDSIVYRAAPQV